MFPWHSINYCSYHHWMPAYFWEQPVSDLNHISKAIFVLAKFFALSEDRISFLWLSNNVTFIG